jgi:4-hydroxythreonine-4-phosphate dehydrogenase
MTTRPRIAVTLGDPRGIGPEITAKSLAAPLPDADIVVLGPSTLTAKFSVERENVGEWKPGDRDAARAGRVVGETLERAVQLAKSGAVQAIVTGPAEKRAFHEAGYDFPGHTEWLAHLAGDVDVAMMLAVPNLRVVLVTTHIPLRQVPKALTTDRVVRTGTITRNALTAWWDIAQPRIAVCAVNPHAGEGGLFGDEDRAVLEPAARVLGATGPLPADTVFVRALKGEFDAVLAPYHDVGMTAIKVAGFGKGVNITLGLPFIRTAPDHGTAFDIAGKGVADPSSMTEALRTAIALATRGMQ